MTDVGTADSWVVVPATVTGPNHHRSGTENQDRHHHRRLPGGPMVLAVADGAGSRSRSGTGAALAVEIATAQAVEHFGAAGVPDDAWPERVEAYADGCLRAFDRAAAEQARAIVADAGPGVGSEAALRDSMATTLLAAVVAPPWLAVVAVGDCFVVVDREPGGSRLLWPTEVPVNSGTTTFLTSVGRDAQRHTFVLHDPNMRGVALCSDGLCEALLTTRSGGKSGYHFAAPPEFTRYFRFVAGGGRAADLEQQFGSKEFRSTSGDDKTMVLAVRS